MPHRAPSRSRTPIVSWVPFGLGHTKPHHFLEMVRVLWENLDNFRYAWRILRHGVCDGCSLGPRGLRDDAIEGIHLCFVRLKMLRLNTMPALKYHRLENVSSLEALDGRGLRYLGRLPYPMHRRRGEPGFRRISWDQAVAIAADRIRSTITKNPDRLAIYTTSRGLTNEVYYVAQKAARLLGTNNIDNAARLCHAASTVALKESIGVGASTISYTDWFQSDFIVLWGSDLANNQPVSTKYLYNAKKSGARIVVINPYREPGLERYWIPSVAKSALFGTRLADEFFQVRIGGDVAFANGALKWLLEWNKLDRAFIAAHTTGFDELKQSLAAQTWESLENSSGVTRDVMRRFAEQYAAAKNAIFIWSMGLTQHTFGVQNVHALVNLALARGMLGRPGAGLVPIRGHSGVQGGAECGSVPNSFPGNFPVNEENARRFSELWGAPVPAVPGLSAPEMLTAAERGALDVFWIAGGNFLETMPEPARIRAMLERVPFRIHQDIVLNSAMLVEPGEEVLLLPAQTRYEQKGGGTITSTERRIRFSPEIPGPRIGEALAEWEIFMRIAAAALGPARAPRIHFPDAAAIRAEMDRAMPLYKGIGALAAENDSVQYGGALLCAGGVCANLPGGRARFSAVIPPQSHASPTPASSPADSRFYLATRRGKQFNSMVWATSDPITGATRRDQIFIAPTDAARLGLRNGDPILLHPAHDGANAPSSAQTPFRGVVFIAPVAPGTLQAFWPEANVLLPHRLDPQSHEPDYNAWVTLERAPASAKK